MNKSKVLIFVRYYLPGYKAGGPVVSISEFINNLRKYLYFYIITSDRDFLDVKPYNNIKTNKWDRRFKVIINYFENNYYLYIRFILCLFYKKKFNIFYFSSLFDFKFTILPIFILKLLNYSEKRIIIAPRGELYSGALRIKKNKKNFFLKISKKIILFSNIVWHATSQEEKIIIQQVFPNSNVILAQNFFASINVNNSYVNNRKRKGKLNIVYYSRITPKKNLKYCIKILSKTSIKFKMHIYGPIDDNKYWNDCENLIKKNGGSEKFIYKGSIKRKDIFHTLSNYDLFFLPTHGENFGHVIFDAINCGLPVLLSNNTPWKNIEKYSIGWSVPLENEEKFIQIINSFQNWELSYKQNFNENSKKFLIENFNLNDVIISYKKLFNI